MTRIGATKRLHQFLGRVAQEQTRLGLDSSVGKLVAAVARLDFNNQQAQYDAYSRLIELCDLSLEEVSGYYFDPDTPSDDMGAILGESLGPVVSIKTVLLANNIQSKAQVLTQFNLAPLSLLAMTVTRRSPEVELQRADIDEARARLEETLAQIRDSDLDHRFKSLFIRLISRAIEALNQYDLFGPDSVTEAIGILLAQGNAVHAQTKGATSAWLWEALKRLGTVLGITYRAYQIHQALKGHDMPGLLPPGEASE